MGWDACSRQSGTRLGKGHGLSRSSSGCRGPALIPTGTVELPCPASFQTCIPYEPCVNVLVHIKHTPFLRSVEGRISKCRVTPEESHLAQR